jgi:hypothetical protein
MACLGDDEKLAAGTIRYLTLADPHMPPFVLATYSSREQDVFLCGSAMRSTWCAARAKALEEVLLLLDSVDYADDGPCNAEDSRATIGTLTGQHSATRRAHIDRQVESQRVVDDEAEVSLRDAVRILLGSRARVGIVTLRAASDGVVVRAVAEDALSVRHCRAERLDVPPDPFC